MQPNIQLFDILTYSRAHNGVTEAKFINNYLLPALNTMGHKPTMDGAGNIYVTVDTTRVLHVAHIDTCHRAEGMLTPLVVDGIIKLAPKDVAFACLGADDGVGIYSNLKLIQAGVGGTYLFTRGEECGGVGAGWIRDNCSDFLKGFDMCIEVDRKGTDEVIISQYMGDCASTSFGDALAEQLSMGHHSSEQGVYTDNAEFAEYIPECVNLSAGYDHQHTCKESVNIGYVEALVAKLIAVKWDELPISREAGDFGMWGNYQSFSGPEASPDMEDYVYKHYDRVAHYLDALGIDVYEIEAEWERTSEVQEDAMNIPY